MSFCWNTLLTDWLRVNLDDVSTVSAKRLPLRRSRSCSGVRGSRRQCWGSSCAAAAHRAPRSAGNRLAETLRHWDTVGVDPAETRRQRADGNDCVQRQRWSETTCSRHQGFMNLQRVSSWWLRGEKGFGAWICYFTTPHTSYYKYFGPWALIGLFRGGWSPPPQKSFSKPPLK